MWKYESHKSYRPITVLTFRANAALGGMAPWGFHVANAALHACVCALFFLFAEILFGSAVPALAAAALFAAHPVHAEAVANIVGRAEGLAGLFFLLALLFYRTVAAQTRSECNAELYCLSVYFECMCAC